MQLLNKCLLHLSSEGLEPVFSRGAVPPTCGRLPSRCARRYGRGLWEDFVGLAGSYPQRLAQLLECTRRCLRYLDRV